jgi:DNA-binding beta-propeller fold protein YncE
VTLKEVARIVLPEHPPDGGFDHAAVDHRASRLYVAHTSNDAVDVVDLATRRFLSSIPRLPGVAGVWVDEDRRLLFSSNRGEDSVSIFDLNASTEMYRLPTGVRPNGLAFDPTRGNLLVAGVGNPHVSDAPPTLSFVDTIRGKMLGRLTPPGRTRWALFHRGTDSFYVNIADPPAIAVVPAGRLDQVDRLLPIPARGPHGLEQDPAGRLLYCACDEGVLVRVDLPSGRAERVGVLAGAPDVLWVNPRRHHLYCAVEDPGVIHVFDLPTCHLLETVPTAFGAGTLTVDRGRSEVHSFLPASHEDLVLQDT